jgi:hypothetical protein
MGGWAVLVVVSGHISSRQSSSSGSNSGCASGGRLAKDREQGSRLAARFPQRAAQLALRPRLPACLLACLPACLLACLPACLLTCLLGGLAA